MKIKYGGALVGYKEVWAILKSVITSCFTGNWQAGKEALAFEKELSDYLNVKHAILTTSGSCAGLLALTSLGLPKGSEVIISSVTFPTIFNIILQCGLIPVVVDAKIGTYGFDIDEVERAITKKTRAIIAIHPVGNPIDMPRLMKVVKNKKIYVIEDNCDGWGSTIGGKKVGSFGDISITSFHAAHIISMGVGGGVFTNSKEIASKVRMYRDWGRQANTTQKTNGKKWKTLPEDYDSRFIYEKIGYNFQILELQAAMGRVQLRKIAKTKADRKRNFDFLNNYFIDHPKFISPIWHRDADVCWFSYPLTYTGNRGELIEHLEKHGIETRSMFAGNITKHPAYENSKFRVSGKLHQANYILEHSFWISCHPRLSQSDLDYIIKTFEKFDAKTSTSNAYSPY